MIKLDLNDNDDDDEVEIMKSKKKLSNIFDDEDGDNNSMEDSKTRLIYKPKQNKKQEEDLSRKSSSSSNSSGSKLSVFIALAVNVYKFENSQYSYVGKFGLALCGNDQESLYRIILYTAKNQTICSATITENFPFLCQQKNYCLIQDDQRQKWSILFENHSDVCQFCRNLAHCLFSVRFIKHNDNGDISVKQPLGFHEPLSDDWSKKFECSNTLICFRLEIIAFEHNCSLHSNPKGRLILLDESVHRCKLEDDNRELFKWICKNPGDRFYLLIPYSQLDYYRKIIPIEKLSKQKPENKIWKIAIEIEMIGFEKDEPTNLESSLQPSSSETFETKDKNVDLATKMSRIGAMPIFPLIQQVKNTVDVQRTTIKEVEENDNSDSQHNPGRSIVDSLNDFQNFLETKFDLVAKNFDDLKHRIDMSEKSKNSNVLQHTNLTLDSTILMNSIQKIIDENHKLKLEIEERKSETARMQQKLFQMIDRGDTGCSSPPNAELILKLKEEIVDLKDRIHKIKEENYRTIQNNNPAPRPRARNQMKQLFLDIHERFSRHPKLECLSEQDRQLVDDVFAEVLAAQLESNDPFNVHNHNQNDGEHEQPKQKPTIQ
ncbi:uncharacterized protein LOC113793143 [Dermatophagoides pteronyssinus]|uniref:uncharacterized protein LOC113793143 n=1 Tax=Dermatophagoides pteronyssinus TaxID=6956 RepID=UPI003F670D08